MTQWKDATNYSQGQRGKIEPTAWETTIGGATVWISSGHRYNPDDWVMNCRALGISELRIGPIAALTLSDVKNAAISACWQEAKLQATQMARLADALFSIPDAIDEASQ